MTIRKDPLRVRPAQSGADRFGARFVKTLRSYDLAQ